MKKNIELKDAFKQYTIDQDKILPPEETVKRFKEKLKLCNLDILEQTIRIDNGRLDIPIFFSICGKDALSITGTKKQMGKGATPQQSEASAVMELAERFSFFSFCKNPKNFIIDTYLNVAESAIPFEMVAQSVHDDSDERMVTRSIFENLPLKWTRGFNLTRGKEVLIPFDWFFMINEFNGPCAGNCVEEAISQGVCEIVERHVSSIISQNRLQVPIIDPKSATDPLIRNMLEKYDRNGITLHLSDFSLDMGIPTVGALAYDLSTYPQKSEIVWTAGTTPSPQKALSRALTEVAQLAGDFNSSSNYVASGLPKFKTLTDAEYITHEKKIININDLPDLSNNNIKVEIQNCIAALKTKGMDVIVVDTMHSLLEIPAFYTIIPGAHFRERALGTSVGLFSAKLLAESRPPQEALHELLKIERLLPRKYYIKFYIGSCYRSLGKLDAAITYYRQALDLDPIPQDLVSIYSYLGLCLKDMGEYRKALTVLKEGEKIDKERTDIYNLVGFCHFKLKEYELAIDSFKKVVQLNPASAIDYANIASNYRDMGDPEKAIRYYELALALDPSIEFARENLVKIQRQS
ncbi:MAG: YcaO-like family protein [Desulfobacterales bacterium]|nr:YcaO-like family protein [Desulfobacterales bacterium]